jgi:hypothetical protein
VTTSAALATQLADDRATIDAVGQLLDGLAPAARRDAVLALSRDQQRRLWDLAGQSPAMTLADLVVDAPARTEVIHDGRNTLPLPNALRAFQKRFCRPDGGGDRLFGYNHGPTMKPIGPGYFVAELTRDRPAWRSRGAIVVDYFQVPDAPVVDTWPKVKPNRAGLQRFVYAGTRDFLRRVSHHVSVGAAYKGERPLDHYFVLCRQEPSARS